MQSRAPGLFVRDVMGFVGASCVHSLNNCAALLLPPGFTDGPHITCTRGNVFTGMGSEWCVGCVARMPTPSQTCMRRSLCGCPGAQAPLDAGDGVCSLRAADLAIRSTTLRRQPLCAAPSWRTTPAR